MKKKELTNRQRQAILEYLLRVSINDKLPYGSLTKCAKLFNVSSRTIKRVWERANVKGNDVFTPLDVQSRSKNRGRKGISMNDIISKVSQLSINKRTTLRSMSTHTGINKSTLHRAKQKGILRRHSESVKPRLTDSNKLRRVEFILSSINRLRDGLVFQNMQNIIHIDEKWFYILQQNRKYYLVPSEAASYSSIQSKRHIPKVMFLCALSRPRYDPHTRKYFDGKIGIWAFAKKVRAQRTSRNRDAGTLELKPITVTREVYKQYLVRKLFPAIRKKFPFQRNTTVFIQQDNAKPHIPESSIDFDISHYFPNKDVRLHCQPPNSPDFNILDLGFFHSVQRLQQKVSTNSIPQLIKAVENSFNDYPSSKVTDIFLTLQKVMESSLAKLGGNDYTLPRGSKNGLNKEEKELFNNKVDSQVYNNALSFLNSHSQ